MRTVALRLAYDGTDFSGWQTQAGGHSGHPKGQPRTVQGCLEAALARIHKRPVAVNAAGRTDAGVHAAGQVAAFDTDIESMEPERFLPALNSILPRDVRILESRPERPGFHARFDARARTYRYFFIPGRQVLPHESRYALHLRLRPDIALLNAYCRLLAGEMDCSIFAAAGDSSLVRGGSPCRNIHRALFLVQGDRLVFEIAANAFLWKMVRSVAGTLLHYEGLGTPPGELADIIASCDRKLAGPTIPPQGLFLWKVSYPVDVAG